MANFPLKMLTYFLQRRSLQTKSSKLPTSSLKPATKPDTKSKKKKSEAKLLRVREKEVSVIALLRSQQFSEAQIARLVEKDPGILKSKVAKNLEPKLKFFSENGFKGTYLPELIMSNPLILRRSLTAHLIPSLELLKTQLGKDNEGALQTCIKRASWLLTLDLKKILQPNIRLLEKEGMPVSSILKLFASQPRSLLCSAERILYGVEMVKKFGVKPDSAMFPHAFRVFISMSESNLKKKLEAFKSLGWSDNDIVSTIVRQPLCLTCSEENLRRSMEFFVNTMKVEPESIIASPKLLMYSLKKRVIPRCNVLMVLQEKKLLEKWTLASVLNFSDKDFIRKYIMIYKDHAPHLLDVYHGKWKTDAAAVKQ